MTPRASPDCCLPARRCAPPRLVFAGRNDRVHDLALASSLARAGSSVACDRPLLLTFAPSTPLSRLGSPRVQDATVHQIVRASSRAAVDCRSSGAAAAHRVAWARTQCLSNHAATPVAPSRQPVAKTPRLTSVRDTVRSAICAGERNATSALCAAAGRPRMHGVALDGSALVSLWRARAPRCSPFPAYHDFPSICSSGRDRRIRLARLSKIFKSRRGAGSIGGSCWHGASPCEHGKHISLPLVRGLPSTFT